VWPLVAGRRGRSSPRERWSETRAPGWVKWRVEGTLVLSPHGCLKTRVRMLSTAWASSSQMVTRKSLLPGSKTFSFNNLFCFKGIFGGRTNLLPPAGVPRFPTHSFDLLFPSLRPLPRYIKIPRAVICKRFSCALACRV
jgi:hypothetical protein